jgi:sigma-B regulation protein RsbU (phosphoserine phosphatase)
LASKIQAGLVPHEDQLLQTGHTRAKSYYHPHDKVGGDYFDVLSLGTNYVGFCMADVSGKGMAAALLMSNFQAMVRALFTAKCDLKTLVADLNARVSANTGGEKFITMFIGRYNCLTGMLTYVNAGHLPPMLYQDGTLTELNEGSIGLGMLDEMPGISQGKIRLHKGDLIVSYTDGLVEVDDGDSVISNTDQLTSIMKMGLGIDDTMKLIAEMAETTRQQGKTFDDTSVLAIEITRKPSLSV